MAYEIEDRFDKDEILELYLSHIYFGNGARGVEAAARHYFGTTASRLTLSQAALLAGLIRGPSRYDPRRFPDRARERRDLVLTLMEQQGRVPAATATAARTMPLGIVRRRTGASADAGLAPYFVEEVRRQLEDRLGERLYDETLTVTTTLDAGLQRAAEERAGAPAARGGVGRAGTVSRPALFRVGAGAYGRPRRRDALPAGRGGRARGRPRRRPRLGGRPRFPPIPLRSREVVAAPGGQRVQAVRVRGRPPPRATT